MRVLFVTPSLSSGGAERVLVTLVKGLKCRAHEVTVVTVYGSELDFFTLPPGVERVALGLGKDTVGLPAKLWANARRLGALRRTIRARRPDVVVSLLGQTNVLTLLATVGLDVPVIVAEHTDPFREPLPGVWNRLRRIAYRRARRVVSVSAAIDRYFEFLPADRRAVIANPVDFAELNREATPLQLPWPHAIVAMGRLSPEKGFDLLIEAFAQLASRFPDWGLAILGEGRLRKNLESMVDRRGLAGRVILPGAIPSPGGTLKKADLFVLSSRWEALPMALIEAMACGLPVAATQCMGGTEPWLRPGENAVLVPTDDVPRLATAIANLIEDPAERQRLGANAARSVRHFNVEQIVGVWEQLLLSVALKT